MEFNNAEVIKAVQDGQELFVIYAQATKLPYVVCDEESFNDQAWFFSTEEAIKEFGQKALEKKLALMGMRFERKDFGKMYGILFAIGVNTIVWVDGDEKTEIDLTKLARPVDYSGLEPEKRPLLNPTLELSAIYFMQEMRRPVSIEEHTENGMRELEEELLVNLCKSEFYLPMIPDENEPDDPKKMHFPFLKDKQERILQPVFSDIMEFQKFAQGKTLRMAKVPFVKLKETMLKQAQCYVFNPLGFNLVLTREQIEKLIG